MEDDILEEFDELTRRVALSSARYYVQHLQRWFDFLDGAPELGPIVGPLENGIDLQEWLAEMEAQRNRGRASGGFLDWPRGGRERLGMQLALFRQFALEKIDPRDIAHNFVSHETNYDQMISDLSREVFDPMAQDLRRVITQGLSNRVPPAHVPTADAVVSLDHNSAAYREAVTRIDDVARAIREANDYPDVDDKEQRLAELEAGKALLRAPQARQDAVTTVFSGLRWLASKFADAMIGKLAELTIAALATLGFWLLM